MVGFWFANRGIRVVHLVREAAVLRLASNFQSQKEKSFHVTDAEAAEEAAKTSQPFAPKSITDLKKQARVPRPVVSARRDAIGSGCVIARPWS
jgi:hypothetical protein